MKYLRRRISRYLRTHWLLIFWIGVNSAIFWSTFHRFKSDPRYYYLRKMLGYGLCVSRATAAILNVSCCLILIPMCKCTTTLIRSCKKQVSPRFVRNLIDKSKIIHKTMAITIVAASVIHILAHLINAYNFSHHYNSKYPGINVAQFHGQNPFAMILTTVPGITGVMMAVLLVLLSVSSSKYIRRMHYNIFWLIHHLFIVFLILLIIHPLSGILKEQVNVEDHIPGCQQLNSTQSFSKLRLIFSDDPKVFCEVYPHFVAQKSITWLWVIIPLGLYVAEILVRSFQRKHLVKLVHVQTHPCHVMELQMMQRNFTASPGQYILIQCPAVSTFEWHPFTLTLCPTIHCPIFSIHLRTLGDWSERLQNVLIKSEVLPLRSKQQVRLYVDGPFSSPTQDVFHHCYSVCIAGGIGVTPFAAILNYMLTDEANIGQLRRLHFIWVCRELQSFLWFAQLLGELYFKLWYENKPDVFDIQLHVTKSISVEKIQNLLSERYSILAKRVQVGRPNWNQLFLQFRQAYSGWTVGVFCCGPKQLSKQVRKVCSQQSGSGAKFLFHEEIFS